MNSVFSFPRERVWVPQSNRVTDRVVVLTGRSNKQTGLHDSMIPCHTTTHRSSRNRFTFCFNFNLNMPLQRMTIISKKNCPDRHVVAGKGPSPCRRKSLELILRKVCSLFGEETAWQRDVVKIKAGKNRPGTDRLTETILLWNLWCTRNNQRQVEPEMSHWDGLQ